MTGVDRDNCDDCDDRPAAPAETALVEGDLVRWLLLTHWHRIRTDPLYP